MNISEISSDSKILSDLIMLAILLVLSVICFQYSHEIQNEIMAFLQSPLQDFNNSVAELSPSRR